MRLIIGLENNRDLVLMNPDRTFLNSFFDWYEATSELEMEEKHKSVYQALQIGDESIRIVIPFSKISFIYTDRDRSEHA